MALANEAPRKARPAASDDEIPILDVTPLHAGRSGALDRLGAQIRKACENIGFYFIINHGVTPAQIASMFALATRRHGYNVGG